MPAILLVEDDPDNRETLARVMAIMGYEIITAVSGEDALQVLDQRDDVHSYSVTSACRAWGASHFAPSHDNAIRH